MWGASASWRSGRASRGDSAEFAASPLDLAGFVEPLATAGVGHGQVGLRAVEAGAELPLHRVVTGEISLGGPPVGEVRRWFPAWHVAITRPVVSRAVRWKTRVGTEPTAGSAYGSASAESATVPVTSAPAVADAVVLAPCVFSRAAHSL